MTVKGKTVAYLYDEELGNYSYGGGNPMRPHRVRLTHSLVETYGLGSRMIQHRPTWQTQDDISQFHADGELCCSSVSTYFVSSFAAAAYLVLHVCAHST